MSAEEDNDLWWCNVHRREATHARADGKRCCDPQLGGIMMSCDAVELTGKAIIRRAQPRRHAGKGKK